MNTTLTPEQATAIADYAASHGRTWKAQLRNDWMNACQSISDLDQQALLQQIRNAFGPSWLAGYKLRRDAK